MLALAPIDSSRPGYALGVFEVGELIRNAWSTVDYEHFVIDIYDVTDSHDLLLVWTNRSDPAARFDQPIAISKPGLWGASVELTLWNRSWRIVARPRLSFAITYPFSGIEAQRMARR